MYFTLIFRRVLKNRFRSIEINERGEATLFIIPLAEIKVSSDTTWIVLFDKLAALSVELGKREVAA